MIRNILRTLAAATIVALPLAASAQNQGDVLLPSQTVIAGNLEQPLTSKSAQVGDPFVLDVVAPFPADDQRYNNARIYGHVASVQRAASTKKGSLGLAFDRITLADGTSASVAGSVISMDAKQNGNSSARGLAGAVVGQILGNYIGKHIGTDVGGAVGAIGGAIYAGNLGTNITVGQGTTVKLQTSQNAVILSRRQAGYPPNGTYPQQQYPQTASPTPYPTPYH